MSTMTIKMKGGTASAIAAENPVLAAREVCFETDTLKFKLGDGTTAYNSLPYFPISVGDKGINA